MLESFLFFFIVAVVCELAMINRNGRKTQEQNKEIIELLKELRERTE
ncbi:YrzO family protein [Bacillus manliponensis]|nr:YrzO family protein [Bacillus manliponensis]